MTAHVIAALLAIIVAATWLGCFGFARLRTPLDRMHCVAFVNVAAGAALTAAAFVADGPSSRAGKILLMTLVSVAGGAAMSHATGRAVWTRDQAGGDQAGGDQAGGDQAGDNQSKGDGS